MKFDYLQTDRLRLRKLTEEVYDNVFKNHDKSEIMKFFNHQSEEEFLKDQQRASRGQTTFNTNILLFHLIDKSTKKTIGTCGYHTWYTDHDRAELGYFMTDDNFKRKGLMTEALKRIIDYGFNEMNLNRIEAFIAPENYPSLKLVARFGFKKEGHLKGHYYKNGKHEDSVVFGLLKSEYNK